MKSLKDGLVMYNGVKVPCVGYGTFQVSDDGVAEIVAEALKVGYRHIDTASFYDNEKGVGEGIRNSNLPREEIFVTTKVWNSDQGYDSTLKAFEKSRQNLGLEYIDLYLIHWPVVGGREEEWVELTRETWRALEELYEKGLVKSIGVSNFKAHHLKSLMEVAKIKPMINQLELHPGWLQKEAVDFCNANEILLSAWGPFSRGKLLSAGLLDDMAKKYNKTVAQLTLRWHLQRGYIPLPRTTNSSRLVENSQIFDFEISSEDMEAINVIKDTGTGRDSDEVAHP